jgi:hypothetical protein
MSSWPCRRLLPAGISGTNREEVPRTRYGMCAQNEQDQDPTQSALTSRGSAWPLSVFLILLVVLVAIRCSGTRRSGHSATRSGSLSRTDRLTEAAGILSRPTSPCVQIRRLEYPPEGERSDRVGTLHLTQAPGIRQLIATHQWTSEHFRFLWTFHQTRQISRCTMVAPRVRSFVETPNGPDC